MFRVVILYSLIWLSTLVITWRLVPFLIHRALAGGPLSGSLELHGAKTVWLSDKCIVRISTCVRFAPIISYPGGVSVPRHPRARSMEAPFLISIVITLECVAQIVVNSALMKALHFRIDLRWACVAGSDGAGLGPHVAESILVWSRVRCSRFVSSVVFLVV